MQLTGSPLLSSLQPLITADLNLADKIDNITTIDDFSSVLRSTADLLASYETFANTSGPLYIAISDQLLQTRLALGQLQHVETTRLVKRLFTSVLKDDSQRRDLINFLFFGSYTPVQIGEDTVTREMLGLKDELGNLVTFLGRNALKFATISTAWDDLLPHLLSLLQQICITTPPPDPSAPECNPCRRQSRFNYCHCFEKGLFEKFKGIIMDYNGRDTVFPNRWMKEQFDVIIELEGVMMGDYRTPEVFKAVLGGHLRKEVEGGLAGMAVLVRLEV